MGLKLIAIALVFSVLSGFPGLFLTRKSVMGRRIAAASMVVSMLTGLSGSFWGLAYGQDPGQVFSWPIVGNSLVGLDPLSSFFLVPVFLVGGMGSIYGLGYWDPAKLTGKDDKLSFFWGTLVAGMVLLLIGRHALAFLLGWEIMALSAFFLVATEDEKLESRKAGFVYLVASHIGTLVLFCLFVILRSATGSYDLAALSTSQIDTFTLNLLFFAALLVFGLKAGVMPLHFWLPGAHANAPTHVSAILSGVVLKMGIYGLLRFLIFLPNPPLLWGMIILSLGATSCLLGVIFAIAQHDIKRLLAYHSVENIGIILIGLGLALIGRTTGHIEWFVLGMSGCLLHVWNHALFKTLLFFCAGSVILRTKIKNIDQLGGLAGRMPWTALLFLAGAIAICGLPPMNGFVSELFIYLGLFGTITANSISGLATGLVIPVLGMSGALAVACFVKVYGTVFSGLPRDNFSVPPAESPLSMRLPMLILGLACLAIGNLPWLFGPILDAVIRPLVGMQNLAPVSVALISPLKMVGTMALILVGVGGVFGMIVFCRQYLQKRVLTWDCAYALPNSRMQYSGSSFAGSIVSIFSWILHPHGKDTKLKTPFPMVANYQSHVDELILDRILVPASTRIIQRFAWFHRFQQGLAQYYIAYILVALILMMGMLIPFSDLFRQLFAR